MTIVYLVFREDGTFLGRATYDDQSAPDIVRQLESQHREEPVYVQRDRGCPLTPRYTP